MERLRELYADYIANDLRLSKSTVEGYSRDVGQYCDYLKRNGILRLQSAGESELEAYLQTLCAAGASPASVRRKCSALYRFYRFLHEKSIITGEGMRAFGAPRKIEKKPDAPGLQEINALLNAPDPGTHKGVRDRAILELICATGIKATELTALDVGDVRLDGATVECGREGSRRTIPIPASVKKTLRRYFYHTRAALLAGKKEKAFFLNMAGDRLTRQGLSKILRGYAKEAGLGEISANSLRYAFAQRLAQKGVKMDSIKQLLGHADKYTTQSFLKGKRKLLFSTE